MKNNLKKIAFVLMVVIIASTVTSCAAMGGAAIGMGVNVVTEGVGLIGDIGEGLGELASIARNAEKSKKIQKEAAAKEEELGRKMTLNEKYWSNMSNNGFNNPAEERLKRRTSELAQGTLVDISPYMMNESSFAVMENVIRHCRTIIDVYNVFSPSVAYHKLFQYDITVTYEANGQGYKNNLTAVTSSLSESGAKKRVRDDMLNITANSLGLSTKDIKKFKVVFNNSWSSFLTINDRKNYVCNFSYCGLSTTIFQDIEPPCYYQFDVEVEYQKRDLVDRRLVGLFKFENIYGDPYFTVFNKVYRSNFTSLTAAAIDVQYAIWEDAYNNSSRNQNPPIINFVKTARYTR